MQPDNFWKTTEYDLALKWGTTNYSKSELDRPNFSGQRTRSHVNGQPVTYFPAAAARLRRWTTRLLLAVALCLCILLSVLAQLVKSELQQHQLTGEYRL